MHFQMVLNMASKWFDDKKNVPQSDREKVMSFAFEILNK